MTVVGMCVCMLCFIFTEYASVGYMAKRIQMKTKRFLLLQKIAKQKRKDTIYPTSVALITPQQFLSSSLLPALPPPPPNPKYVMKGWNVASDIDKYSRVIFPVTFTCFQLMYWILYQYLSSYDIADNLHPDHL